MRCYYYNHSMNTNNAILPICIILGVLVIFTGTLVFSRDHRRAADDYLNKLRLQQIDVYLDIHQR